LFRDVRQRQRAGSMLVYRRLNADAVNELNELNERKEGLC